MGIVNVTPDSFSGDGLASAPDQAMATIQAMLDAQVDWIDLGAESTRPGHEPVTAEQEWARLQPLIENVPREKRNRLSVDTSKTEVAKQALALGVGMINDVWGNRLNSDMAAAVAKHHAHWVLMHNSRDEQLISGRDVSHVVSDLQRCAEHALSAGVAREKIWIDPGIGFGKPAGESWTMTQALRRFADSGFRTLYAPSRKSFLQDIDNQPAELRDETTMGVCAWAVSQGVDAIRVHNWRQAQRMVRGLCRAAGA